LDFSTKCPICGTDAQATQPGDSLIVACPRCSTYEISGTAIRLLELTPLTEEQAGGASGWVREAEKELLSSQDVDRLRALQPPTVAEQGTRLLRHLAKDHRVPGDQFDVLFRDPELQGITWSTNNRHLSYLIVDYLATEKEFITLANPHPSNDAYRVKITPAGWAALASLRSLNTSSSQAFVAMHFAETTMPLRKDGLIPAVSGAGFRPMIIDEKDHNNDMIDEILSEIRQSRFVVADFTEQRGGVYHEAGFAQGLGLPVIRTCKKDQVARLHFDVNHYPFVLWEDEHLPDFRERLQRRIEAVIGRGPLPTS
jgi:hypothetical protein